MRVILFSLTGDRESNNYWSCTASLSAVSSASLRKKAISFPFVPMLHPVTSHLLCYFHLIGASSQNFFMPLAYLVCKVSTETNHVSYTQRSIELNILLNQWFLLFSPGCFATRAWICIATFLRWIRTISGAQYCYQWWGLPWLHPVLQ